MTAIYATESTRTFGHSEPFKVGFDPLRAMPRKERKPQLERYLDYLRERDGTPNLEEKTLSRREQFFAELAEKPVRWQGAFDRDLFHAHLAKPPGPDVDPKVLWALAAAKSNRVEHYGVQLDLALKGSKFASHKHGDHMTYIDLEEFYHTRILRDACKVFDLEYDILPPKSFTRFFAALVVRSPFRARLITALCGELFGCVAFEVLWERTDLFAAEPDVMARLRLLTREILIDEAGHTAFGHAMLGRGGLVAARAILWRAASYFLDDIPEFAYLAGGRRPFLERVAAFDLGKNQELWDLAAAPV